MAATFETFGPYVLKRYRGEANFESLDAFWEDVDNFELETARGVYIVGTRHGTSAVKPWYVGQTHRSFKHRFNEHMRGCQIGGNGFFAELRKNAPNGDLQVFFLARTTSTGNMWKGAHKKLKSIRYLETLLIEACLIKNKHLLNVSQAELRKSMCVPGFLNDRRGKPNASARALSRMFTKY